MIMINSSPQHFPSKPDMSDLSENVGKCRKIVGKLSENVGKCRKMSENVGKMSENCRKIWNYARNFKYCESLVFFPSHHVLCLINSLVHFVKSRKMINNAYTMVNNAYNTLHPGSHFGCRNCRKMSENVGKCRKMSEDVGKCRKIWNYARNFKYCESLVFFPSHHVIMSH
jgi:hypothetical protein